MLKIMIFFILYTSWSSKGKWAVPKKVTYQKPKKFSGFYTCYIWHCVIKIDPTQKDDIGLMMHEQMHTQQFGRLLWLHSLLYTIYPKYRLISELEAYREQVLYREYNNKIQYDWIIETLLKNYNLNIDKKIIKKMADKMFADIINKNKEKIV
ncbi:MAG: hypothetical protein QM493_02505 [Sulfurovum sp.]